MIDKRKDGGFEVALSVEVSEPGFIIRKETPSRYKYYEVNDSHIRISEQIGGKKMVIPSTGKDLLQEVAGKLAGLINIQSVLETEALDIPKIIADPQIHLFIVPMGEGFRLETFVKPFKSDPPFIRPGSGRENIMAEIQGQRMQAVRDLKAEKKSEQTLIQASELMSLSNDGSHEWIFDSPEDCLQILLDLEPLTDQIVIEWPEGQKLKIASRAALSSLSINIRKEKDWFEASGQLKLDNGAVMSLLEVMRLLESSPGRFVQLSSGEFLALTGEFRKRLDEMRAWSDENKNSLRIHPLAAPAWEEAASAAGDFKTDKAWRDKLTKLKNARAIRAEVPSTFEADMRPYQEEGFHWLTQLAQWEVGACLADDMGLGKTIQALALLLYRADVGPSLVVAPPTVARNWVSETRKFAPTLNPILYAGKDREHLLHDLGPFDLLITSYGLLQSDIEKLSTFEWNVAVLDEAQSIKNFQAKRSKAAMEIQAGFKMITTGTPIENHLGELWNLFTFINPGLLGSLKDFNERYAIPIEKLQNTDRRRQLQKLIHPFILRRRKNQVLDELPEKTEVTLSVELSEEEAALYEAMRIHAVEKLSNLSGKAGEKQLQILAEIMRLRRLCCHPKLVDKNSKVAGSKLAIFGEIVNDLRENNHKALVFSQFVGHLDIVREWVEDQGIPYQYLDGSTPQKQREIAIKSFQSGKGDLFLISLKAGGVGLNLTAADYVIHLDPWWNPAVEDQASDRAHRIGQERPVTIYRLVTKGTIEEKILQLHHDKRDLADSLLEGTDTSGKLSADALLQLLREI
ncbi:MAG: DEAD/DEAH box helicase [Bacteroidia bacterium]